MEVQEIFETLTDPGAPAGEDDDAYTAALRTLDTYIHTYIHTLY